MNQYNTLRGDEPTETPINWNRQPPAAHFKSSTSPTKTIPVVLTIIGRLNYYTIDDGDV